MGKQCFTGNLESSAEEILVRLGNFFMTIDKLD